VIAAIPTFLLIECTDERKIKKATGAGPVAGQNKQKTTGCAPVAGLRETQQLPPIDHIAHLKGMVIAMAITGYSMVISEQK